MERNIFPTGRDIYLELNGRKLAVVESYTAKSTRETRFVEALGEKEPVGTSAGRIRHVIELRRVYAADGQAGDGADFFSAGNFNLVIVKPDRRIIYSGCEWADITEGTETGDLLTEKITILAARRMELR